MGLPRACALRPVGLLCLDHHRVGLRRAGRPEGLPQACALRPVDLHRVGHPVGLPRACALRPVGLLCLGLRRVGRLVDHPQAAWPLAGHQGRLGHLGHLGHLGLRDLGLQNVVILEQTPSTHRDRACHRNPYQNASPCSQSPRDSDDSHHQTQDPAQGVDPVLDPLVDLACREAAQAPNQSLRRRGQLPSKIFS